MKTFVVQRDRKLPLRFVGDMAGFVEDATAILILYKTEGGQYVC